jgi:hypothetical protein
VVQAGTGGDRALRAGAGGRSMLRGALANIGAAYELARLAVLTRFRFRGPYWRWRTHTAFGRGYPRSRLELVRAVLAYGRWVRRMRRR